MARKCPECGSAMERDPGAHALVCLECDYEEPEDTGGGDGDLGTREDGHAQLDDGTWGGVSDRKHAIEEAVVEEAVVEEAVVEEAVVEEAVTESEYDDPRPERGADGAAAAPGPGKLLGRHAPPEPGTPDAPRKILGLPWLQTAGILVGFVVGAIVAAGALLASFR